MVRSFGTLLTELIIFTESGRRGLVFDGDPYFHRSLLAALFCENFVIFLSVCVIQL